MKRTEIIIAGFGGQGVIFAGELLGRAAMLAGLHAAQSASYGSEARGSATNAGIIISDVAITYPKVAQPDILIALSQEACDKFASKVKPDGKIIFDCDTIESVEREDVDQIGFPATANAARLGKKTVANVIILSYAIALTKVVPVEALKQALTEQTPEKFLQLNLRALGVGSILGVE
ncbi:2-oxoacid:acceptor oxidoreductase family protein [Calditrichota bacterium]